MVPKEWAVVPFVYLQTVAFCTNLYIVPQLAIFKVCHITFNSTVCSRLGQSRFKSQENYVFSKAAEWNALINFAGFFPATLLILPLGSMTDLVTKRKILLLPAIASLLSCLINLCSSIFTTLHMSFLVLASFILSICGDEPGCTMLCCAYSVCARLDNRLLAIIVVIASVESGLATGNLIANYLARYYGYSSAFLLAAFALVVDLLYLLILIPPLDDENKKHPEKDNYYLWNDFKEHTKDTWLHLVSFIRKHILHSKDKTVLLLLVATFLTLASYGGERALIALFLKHSPLNFKADEIGIYLTLYELSRAAGLIVIAILIKRYWQSSNDYTMMFIAATSTVFEFTVLSLSTTKLMVYLSTILAFPTTIITSAARSQLIKLVDDGEQGIALSLVGLLCNASVLVMSVGANGLFIATAKIFSGFSMLLVSFSNTACIIILCYIVCINKKKETTEESDKKLLTKFDDKE